MDFKIKLCLFFSLIILLFSVKSQPPCLPAIGGIEGQDNPPGCIVNDENFRGTTSNFTPDTTGFLFPCGEIIGNQWFTVMPNSAGKFEINLFVWGCERFNQIGGKLILFDMNFNIVSECKNNCGTNNDALKLSVQDLIPGECYQLMFDPCEPNSNCNIQLNFPFHETPSINISAGKITATPYFESYCVGSRINYSIEPVEGATGYSWTFDEKYLSLIRGGGMQDTFIRVLCKKSVFGPIIDVYPLINCSLGIRATVSFRINPQFQKEQSKIICQGEEISIGTQTFNSEGDYSIFIEGFSSFCDTILNLKILIPDTSVTELACIQDDFLNILGINWNRKPLADQYEIYINDSLVSVQDYAGYIYHPQFSGEEIDIKIQPIGSHGCEYAPDYLTCTAPNFTNSRELFEEEVVSVFPNPSSGVFEVFSEERVERIEVFDFSGKKVTGVFSHRDSFGGKEIDLSEFESGVYFLKIYFEKEIVLKKVIKL